MGIAMMGNNFGGVVMPGIIGAVIVLGGWQSGYYLQGLLTSLVAVAVLIALREPKMGPLNLKVPSKISNTSPEPIELPGMSISDAVRSKALYILLYCHSSFLITLMKV